jgi:hypothetical protein
VAVSVFTELIDREFRCRSIAGERLPWCAMQSD